MGMFNNDLSMVRVNQPQEKKEEKKGNVFRLLKPTKKVETKTTSNTPKVVNKINPDYQTPVEQNTFKFLNKKSDNKKYKVSGNPADFINPDKLKVNDKYKSRVNKILGR